MPEAPHPVTVGVLGGGRVHGALWRRPLPGVKLATVSRERLAQGADRVAAVLSVSDCWQSHALTEVAALCRAGGQPYLPARVEMGQAVIGPTVLPGRAGCPTCAELRRSAAREDAAHRAALLERDAARLAETPSTWLTSFSIETVAACIGDEVARLIDGDTPRTYRALLLVGLDDLAVRRHPFLPHPRCPECGDLPVDRAEDAVPALRARPKSAPDVFRVRRLRDVGALLGPAFTDPETGLVPEIRRVEAWGLPTAFARVARAGGVVDYGVGRASDHEVSGHVATLEALERYAGLVPGGKRTAVRAPYAELQTRAVDPRRFGLYPPEHYGPDFPYAPFREERALPWVWGYSFGRQQAVLVPECLVYYGLRPRRRGELPLAYETSNGCALGACLEEAILYGLFEVAERDAFLMTWYTRLAVPRMAVESFRDRSLALTVRRTEQLSGYELRVFNITLEQCIPAIWAMAVDAGDGADRPALLCAAGAHLDPARACASAVGELATMLATTPAQYAEKRSRVHRMVADADAVRTMEDHSLLYCDSAVSGRLDFLLDAVDEQAMEATFPEPVRHDDLRQDLMAVVERYLGTGLEVVVVDQTTPELRLAGLRCVKVLVPGTLPMTFGHRARRIHGLPRLYSVPQLLGYRQRPLDPGEVNPHPHPFP
jgi:ribosomal protein S12 methylthiotransferase accessory factor